MNNRSIMENSSCDIVKIMDIKCKHLLGEHKIKWISILIPVSIVPLILWRILLKISLTQEELALENQPFLIILDAK